MAPKAAAKPVLSVPELVLSPSDVRRARRELATVEAYLSAQQVRTPGRSVASPPKVSRYLESFVNENRLNMLQAADRQALTAFLRELAERAPVVHLSFAAEPSFAALQKIVRWLRQQTNANVLVQIGVQPALVAGCVVRTTNRYFDFSLRTHLAKQGGYLMEALQK